ncbi:MULTISPECIES: glycosyltransferase family 4 protein [Paenibacillus]|uniref:Glycosyltransferase involved in cell wall biosynthesis n=1 Tax=Paenibacillus pabuli TaxID=1472 RepID=A0A855Y1G5_9BACL|nr:MULTISPECIES: glycosyltransferase family 4 protein [Paenibacillus]PWW45225.1 glycosyltransferase involved in cell wall biosynthesis [Paenibacillus pabuli]PXW11562.1 glycosyltransferase involved in cell wall biosynthesis [Paenibacillus taichungensis]
MKPKIVFVINYFYPDVVSTGQIMTELCLYLQNDFDITVIAAQTEGTIHQEQSRFILDQLEQIQIIKISLPDVNKENKLSRLKYISAYFVWATVALLKQKNVDLIYTISQPPVLGGVIGTIGKLLKRTKHIYNIQDFNPEQAEAVGYSKKKWIANAARWVDTLSCKLADHVVTVGEDMRETLERRFNNRKVTDNSVIHNWTDEQEIVPLSKDHPKVSDFLREHHLEGKFVIMYSGNLGLYYDLENLIKMTGRFAGYRDLAFVFIGEGAVKRQMQDYVEQHGISQVYFLPFQAKENLKYSLNAADVHLVVNQKGIKGVSVPSKIYGVMAAGKPVLGVLEQGSEGYRIISESMCGRLIEPQRYEMFVKHVKDLYMLNRDELKKMGLEGRGYLEQHLKRNVSMEKYKVLLSRLASKTTDHQVVGKREYAASE